jgi:hypothetical protein
MKKRTWHYAYSPKAYEVHCDKCHGDNTTWSEFIHKVWCYDCKIDTDGTAGIFGGPIPYEATLMLIGPYAFHRYYFKSGIWMSQRWERPMGIVMGKMRYRRCVAPKLA